jgi:PBSX family phage portal protein
VLAARSLYGAEELLVSDESTALATVDDAAELEATATAKAYVIEVESQQSNAAPTTEDDARVFLNYGAIIPPYDPRQLSSMFEKSTALRPNVDAYKTNIEGFGYRLEPTIDLDAEDVDEKIADAILLTKIADDDPFPTAPEEEVGATKLTLKAEMRLEKLRLEQFFKNCGGNISFIELRERTRQELETTGNAFWEILRDGRGRPVRIELIPAPSMRLMRAELKFSEVVETRRVSPTALRQYAVKRRLRRFVQVLFGQFIAYFKELDDPRVMSSRSGRVYVSTQALQRQEPGVAPATEVLHFRIHSPLTAYGVPRWVGASLAVLGSRAAEEVNVTYFDNKAVPPMCVLVSGGKLAAGMAERIRDYIRDNIKGRDNFHAILVLEAEPAAGALAGANGSRCRIEIKNLMDSQNQDGLFQEYDANNTEKVGNQFRLPKLLRGDTKDFNRATADAALDYAEQQVFAPERTKMDHLINRRLMGLLDSRFFEFVSNGVQTKDQPELAGMIKGHVQLGILTPNEGRELSSDVFGKTFKKLEHPWADQPLSLSLAQTSAGLGVGADGPPPSPDEAKALEFAASRLVQLRAKLAEWEGVAGQAALDMARKGESEHVIRVPAAEFNRWFESAPT